MSLENPAVPEGSAVGKPTLGAWKFGPYRFVPFNRMGEMDSVPTYDQQRVNATISDIQLRLLQLGYDPGRTDGVFVRRTKRAVKAFQKATGLTTDGTVGRTTCSELYRDRVKNKSRDHGVPKEISAGIIIHESGWDPAAVGASTPEEKGIDRGWFQINSLAQPNVDDVEAFAAMKNLSWGLNALENRHANYASKPDIAWDCAIVANLSPVVADAWFSAGKTSTNDKYAKFVADVKAMGEAFWAE